MLLIIQVLDCEWREHVVRMQVLDCVWKEQETRAFRCQIVIGESM